MFRLFNPFKAERDAGELDAMRDQTRRWLRLWWRIACLAVAAIGCLALYSAGYTVGGLDRPACSRRP